MAHKFNFMSRFVADVWGVVALALNCRESKVRNVATKSQILFRTAGINHATTGKMSTRQAVVKINALVQLHEEDFYHTFNHGIRSAEVLECVHVIVAYKPDTDTLMVYGNSDDTLGGKRFEELNEYSKDSSQPFGIWYFNMGQFQDAVAVMLDQSSTTKTETMGQTPQEWIASAMENISDSVEKDVKHCKLFGL